MTDSDVTTSYLSSSTHLAKTYAHLTVRRARGRLHAKPQSARTVIAEYGPIPTPAGSVEIRPLRNSDAASWASARIANEDRMRKWWPPVSDWRRAHDEVSFLAHRRYWQRQAKQGTGLNFAVVIDGQVRGEVTMWDFAPTGTTLEIGVWADPRVLNRVGPLAAFLMVMDHVFDVMKMERVTNPIADGNVQSMGLTRIFGFQEEGTFRSWRGGPNGAHDYKIYSLLSSDWPAGREKVLKLLTRMDQGVADRLR